MIDKMDLSLIASLRTAVLRFLLLGSPVSQAGVRGGLKLGVPVRMSVKYPEWPLDSFEGVLDLDTQ